jgi:hypothetical protein
MAKDSFDAALTGFRRWAKTAGQSLSGDPRADADELGTLLDLMRDYLGIDRPADLGQGDLEDLLLRIYPRKITVLDRADTADTIPAVRDFLAYLADSEGMPEGTARRLDRELDRIAPRFANAVMDPSNWGMARSLVQAMAADGVDLGDQAAVDGWIAAYNTRVGPVGGAFDPGEEYEDDGADIDLKEAFGLPDQLPPIRLPAEAELAEMARGVPLIGQLQALTAWLGTGRVVTENAELADGDAAEAAAALGIGAPLLAYLWHLALDAEFIELDEDETHAVPGEVAQAWPDSDDDEVRDIWEMLFALVMGTLEIVASLDPRRSGELDFSGQGAALAVMLFLARPDGLSAAEVGEVIRSDAVDELAPARAAKTWQSWVRAHGDPARLLLDQMVAVGAVRISDSEDADLARLTPLGLAAIRTQFAGSGVEVPLLPPAEEMTAADLIAMAAGAAEEEFEAETAAWLAQRTAESAARELLSVAAESDPASRVLAVAVVTELGAPAEPAWRNALDQVELRAYAKATLADCDPVAAMPDGLELSDDDLAWVLTDALVADGWDDVDDEGEYEPAALAKRLGEAIPAGREPAAFEMMARVPHPDAANVLTVIGRYHPDKKIAKAARKSAYKAASRQVALRR